jgi:hypothetical protein
MGCCLSTTKATGLNTVAGLDNWSADLTPWVLGQGSYNLFIFNKLVGARGFEPPTPWSRTRCATRLRYAPTSNGICTQGRLKTLRVAKEGKRAICRNYSIQCDSVSPECQQPPSRVGGGASSYSDAGHHPVLIPCMPFSGTRLSRRLTLTLSARLGAPYLLRPARYDSAFGYSAPHSDAGGS